MDVIKGSLNLVSCNFSLKLCLGFQIELVLHAHSILKSSIWFQPKLYSTQFNYHYKLYVYIYIYIYIYIVTDHFIFSRITCLRVFIQSYMLLNIIENTKGKYQFGELKSCYPMTTWRWLILVFQTMVGLVNNTSNQTQISWK